MEKIFMADARLMEMFLFFCEKIETNKKIKSFQTD